MEINCEYHFICHVAGNKLEFSKNSIQIFCLIVNFFSNEYLFGTKFFLNLVRKWAKIIFHKWGVKTAQSSYPYLMIPIPF